MVFDYEMLTFTKRGSMHALRSISKYLHFHLNAL